jgi:aspartyl-tRNA(Asn)/glutamyl-tRNA(Gln) amidotransferase subunit A
MELHELSAARCAEMIRSRQLSPVELVQALLTRIETLEPSLQAWETIDAEGALAEARLREKGAGDEELGPLHGVPVGVKDIFYTKGLRTTSGSPMFRDFAPSYDATSVARLRQAGAIVLGKTVTVQFAYQDPPRTRNPWNDKRTPGGSSSGSGAAVATRMVPAALGSQTGGSVLRPAAYCGVVGLKPTYGRISRYGVTPASWSLDHVGHLVRTVEDAALLLQVMAGHDPSDQASARVPLGDYLRAAGERDRAPRIGLVQDYLDVAHPEMASHLREVAARFEAAGAEVQELRLPERLPVLLAIRAVIGLIEAANLHARTLQQHPEGYAPKMQAQVEVGQLVPGAAYIQAQRLRRRFRPQIERLLAGVDCLLMPTVAAVAPDTSTTGDSAFQGVWSLFGSPSITLPSGLSSERLPLAIQLVAPDFQEEQLLRASAWCEAVLGPMPSPV